MKPIHKRVICYQAGRGYALLWKRNLQTTYQESSHPYLSWLKMCSMIIKPTKITRRLKMIKK